MESNRSVKRVAARKEFPSSLDLLPLGHRFGDSKMMARARPNSKFEHIKAKTDHGKKPPKTVMETDDKIRVTKLRGENFGRIAHNVLSRYIVEGHRQRFPGTQLDAVGYLRQGHFPATKPDQETDQAKIILLDLRPTSDYHEGHIKNAVSFPAVNIQKDYEFSKLNLFKNKPDKLLVVYADDERHGILTARVIFEKGFDNLYLLSGGFLIFAKENPELIDQGTPIAASETQSAGSTQKYTEQIESEQRSGKSSRMSLVSDHFAMGVNRC